MVASSPTRMSRAARSVNAFEALSKQSFVAPPRSERWLNASSRGKTNVEGTSFAEAPSPSTRRIKYGGCGALSGALGRLMVVAEAYPDLKANANMMQLSEELTSTENKVAFARQAFNDAATQYNIYKQSFPAVVFAGMFGHARDASLLEFDSAAIAEAPKVSF